MKTVAILLLAGAAAFPAMANDAHHPEKAGAASATVSDTVAAEVRRVDTNTGKVTLSHGPLKNLGMPGMTMGFPVANREQLKGIATGDRVTATIAKVNDDYVVTRLESSK